MVLHISITWEAWGKKIWIQAFPTQPFELEFGVCVLSRLQRWVRKWYFKQLV